MVRGRERSCSWRSGELAGLGLERRLKLGEAGGGLRVAKSLKLESADRKRMRAYFNVDSFSFFGRRGFVTGCGDLGYITFAGRHFLSL